MVLDRIEALEHTVAELTKRVNSLHEVQKQVAAERKEAELTAKQQAKDVAVAEAEQAKREHPPLPPDHPARQRVAVDHPARKHKHKHK